LALGGSLTCVALLTLAAVASLFRSSNATRWTSRGCVGEFVALAIVGTLALGVGCLAAGAINVLETRLDHLDLGLLAGVVLVAIVIWRRLKPRAVTTVGPVLAAASGQAPPRGAG
jgi:hypothetical protein